MYVDRAGQLFPPQHGVAGEAGGGGLQQDRRHTPWRPNQWLEIMILMFNQEASVSLLCRVV